MTMEKSTTSNNFRGVALQDVFSLLNCFQHDVAGTGQRTLVQPLSYLVRTGWPDGWDLVAATNFATIAVDLVTAGTMGRLLVFGPFSPGPEDAPLEVVTQPSNRTLTEFYNAETYTPNPDMFKAVRAAQFDQARHLQG
ncbi:MAG: hypothetical protein AAF468_21105 [Pseudomonadota bacterium]